MTPKPPALIADIGGTNARFALSDGAGEYRDMSVVPCAEYPDLTSAIEAYLAPLAPERRPDRAVIDVACPINGDRVALTNRDWSFSVSETRSRLGLAALDVVNDFEAVARSVPFLEPADVVQIGSGEAAAGYPIVALGPGTGLGVAVLVPAAGDWISVPGEGGHASLAAMSPTEDRIIDILRRRYGHASAERALSGPGLVNLYQALCEIAGLPTDPAPAPSEITERAIAGSCPTSAETVAVFCRFLGTVASNLALTVNARSGVFLAGGILPRIAALFRNSDFRRRFEQKGRFSDMLKPIPTFLVVHHNPALLGLSRLVSRG